MLGGLGTGPLGHALVRKEDALGQYDELPIRELSDDAFAEGLMVRPDIAEVAAAMHQDGPGRNIAPQGIGREPTNVGSVADVNT